MSPESETGAKAPLRNLQREDNSEDRKPAGKKLARSAPVGSEPRETLSDREYQVLLQLAAGKSVKEIGAELSLSVKTISTYRTRIFQKLQFRSNTDVIHYAKDQRLVE
jgi:DNA-binding NarL/FixJ family response regulator